MDIPVINALWIAIALELKVVLVMSVKVIPQENPATTRMTVP